MKNLIKGGCLLIIAFWLMFVIGGVFNPFSNGSSGDSTPSPTVSENATQTPTPTPKPNKHVKAAPLNYWTTGFTFDDVSFSTSKNCTFDMCVFIKMHTTHTCSSISLDGSIYDINDEYIDSFSQDYGKLKAGKTITVEFGTDSTDPSEDYVELDDATCYK